MKSAFSHTNEEGLTSLHLAAKFGRVEIVKWLAVNEVNLNKETPQGYSPIHLTAMNGHVNCLMVNNTFLKQDMKNLLKQ